MNDMKAIKLMSVLLLLFLITSCTDSKLEQRINSLEERVAQLEKGNGKSERTMIKPASNVVTEEAEANPDGKYPKFDFQETSYDFGTVNEGDIVNHIFKFTNTGEAPLVIKNAVASCGCTVPSWPKEPIAPGANGEIEVNFNSKGKPNQQTKTITITANTDPTISRLTIKGMVTPKGGS